MTQKLFGVILKKLIISWKMVNTEDAMDGQFRGRQARFNYIDVIKGIAILFVILVHVDQKIKPNSIVISNVSSIGARAPQLFFVISGYLTWRSADNRYNKSFFIKRAYRIIPSYYIALFLSLIFVYFNSTFPTADNIIAHLFLVHGLSPYWINSIIEVGWFVGDLVIFYMLFPLLKKIIKDMKTSLFCFIVCVILSSLVLVLYRTQWNQDLNKVEIFFTTQFFIHQLPCFLLGIVIFYLDRYTDEDVIRQRRVLISYALILIALLFIFYIFNLNKRILTSSLIAGMISSWIVLFSKSIRNVFDNKIFTPFVYLGKHSYSIYLFHYLVICWVDKGFSLNNSLFHFLLLFTVSLSVSLAISVIISQIEYRMEKKRIRKCN